MPPTKQARKPRQPMLAGGAEVISVSMGKPILQAAQTSAFSRQIPFSMWMREAAYEKLAREKKARSPK